MFTFLKLKNKLMPKRLYHRILLSCCIVFMAHTTYSQTNFKGFDLGLQVILNSSKIHGIYELTDIEDTQLKASLRPGIYIFGTKTLQDGFYLKPGIGLNFKGGKTTSYGTDEYWGWDDYETASYSSKTSVKASFLEFPLMLGYEFSDKILIESGLSLGFILSGNSEYEEVYRYSNGTIDRDSERENILPYTKGTELVFHIGAKYAISPNLFGGIKYFSGSDMNKYQVFSKTNFKGFAIFVETKI